VLVSSSHAKELGPRNKPNRYTRAQRYLTLLCSYFIPAHEWVGLLFHLQSSLVSIWHHEHTNCRLLNIPCERVDALCVLFVWATVFVRWTFLVCCHAGDGQMSFFDEGIVGCDAEAVHGVADCRGSWMREVDACSPDAAAAAAREKWSRSSMLDKKQYVASFASSCTAFMLPGWHAFCFLYRTDF
jgi:hypothetical protein